MVHYKHLYSNSLKALDNRLHFAAHSHHLWPDCIQEAQNQYVLDAFQQADQKWGGAIAQVELDLKAHLIKMLGINRQDQICFAPNAHTLLFRLISCFDLRKSLKILSTDSEFYSFKRQADRLTEWDNISLTEVPVLPNIQFKSRFLKEVKDSHYDIVYLSHVFFNSGLIVDFIEELVEKASSNTMIIIDGYHATGAIPIDLSKVQDRIFYLGGGYKYLQSGEGVCFMTTPNHSEQYRPLYTGWFAEFEQLEQYENRITYAPNANKFLGATTDPSGMYRMRSVFEMWQKNGLDINAIHTYIVSLQARFLSNLSTQKILGMDSDDLMIVQEQTKAFGHFLTFKTDKASEIQTQLKTEGIITDSRGDRLRFGFGLYHDSHDIDDLFRRVNTTSLYE